MLGEYAFPSWVPSSIVDGYKEKGVNGLFKWQHDIVSSDGEHENLVYSAPTSAGKSLVAELLALRVALSGKRVVFVLPYISVAREKLIFLQRLWRRIDIQVAGFIGANSSPSREWTAAVCTIEKAGSLINHAILDGALPEYGLVVLDELHMVADPSRGANLESLGTKLLYYNQKSAPHRIRIVAMSATVSDLKSIGEWLQAKTVESDFRPIALSEQYSSDGVLYDMGSTKVVRQLDIRFRYPGDLDCTVGFSVEAFVAKKLILVFCSSKSEVEKIAIDIARAIHNEVKASPDILEVIDNTSLLQVKDVLERSCRELDPILLKTLPRAVAYHHAGLTSEERDCIENAFRDGIVRVLVATSTLSSGVNLPANRVVIKSQTRGPAAISAISYRQMAGRAGRMGHVAAGESIVTSRHCDQATVLKLIVPKPAGDCLKSLRDPSKIILEGICCGMATSLEDIEQLTYLLLFPTSRSPIDIICELAGLSLIAKTKEDNGEVRLESTQLGRAALASSLPPEAAMFVFNDLQLATKALAIDTELHMLYLITPVNTSVWQGCDWNHLHNIFTKLTVESRRVAKMVNVNERFIVSRIQGSFVSPTNHQLQTHLRFFSALMLYDVINENSVADVAEKYHITRGSLQALQQQSATYAVMVVAFCNRLGWLYLRSLLDGFASRLAFGIRSELTDLVKIEGIDGARARVFHEHDITSLMQLAQCSLKQVKTVLSLAVPFESNNVNDGLGEWLSGETRISLQDAAELVITRAEEAVSANLKNLGFSINYRALATKCEDATISQSSTITSPPIKAESESAPSTAQCANSIDTDCLVPQYNVRHASENLQTSYCTANEGLTVTTPHAAASNKSARRSSRLASTPVGLKPPRPSLSCSRIEDSSIDENSMDLFTDSLLELTLDEEPAPVDYCTTDDAPLDRRKVVEDHITGEVDDLETSLLKIAAVGEVIKEQSEQNEAYDSFDDSVYFSTLKLLVPLDIIQTSEKPPSQDDSFDKTVELIRVSQFQRLRGGKIEAMQPIRSSLPNVPISNSSENNALESVSPMLNTDSPSSPCNMSGDLFEDSISNIQSGAGQIQKRSLKQRYSQPCSPLVSSPLGKQARFSSLITHAPFTIRDVCRSYSEWQSFVFESSQWSEFGISIASDASGKVLAIAVCTLDGFPYFVPMTDDYFPGTEIEEESYPSSTPCHSVSLEQRQIHLAHICSSFRAIAFNGLDVATSLRKGGITVCNPVCISYLAFLAHLRNGDQMLPPAQLVSKFQLPFDIQNLLRGNPRISCAAAAYAAIRLFSTLKSSAEFLSSRVSVEIELKSINVINDMCTRGFPFRSRLCESMLTAMRERINMIEGECHKLAGHQFNLESSPQVSDLLFGRLRLPCPGGSASSTRQRSTCKAVLEQMTSLHPIVSKIIEFRRLKYSINNCLVPHLSLASSRSVIHTHMQICTATGRLLSYEPNIQNVPKGYLMGSFQARSLFFVSEGCKLVSADYSQLELRILAHLSDDRNLLERIADTSRDFFSDLAIQWGYSRDCVKLMCYGIIYGMGVKSLSETTKTSVEDATALMKSFFNSFPKVRSFINDTKDTASRNGFVTTLLGRRRICSQRGKPEEIARDQRQSLNFCIQGTASEIFKQAIINLHENLTAFNARLLMTVHDEVLIECPSEHCTVVFYDVIRNSMENVFSDRLRVRLRVSISAGPSWGELSKVPS